MVGTAGSVAAVRWNLAAAVREGVGAFDLSKNSPYDYAGSWRGGVAWRHTGVTGHPICHDVRTRRTDPPMFPLANIKHRPFGEPM